MRINKEELLAALPPEWPESPVSEIRARVEHAGVKIVVFDDDPTGTQTVYDVPVLTEWSPAALAAMLADPEPLAFVLANSRGMPLAEARRVNYQIAANLRAAGKATGRDFVVVSRGDSTLRGHYPDEVLAILEGLELKGSDSGAEMREGTGTMQIDGIVLIPFFLEGGRYTIDDVHYVAEADWLVPAAETEFARDAAFAYRNSNLRQWVAEKHRGQIETDDVASITLADLRIGGPDAVAAKLGQLHGGRVCIVNAAGYRDLEVFALGLLQAEAAGQRFICRTAASFIRARAGLGAREPLTAEDLDLGVGVGIGGGSVLETETLTPALSLRERESGGLIIAGSYVQRSTAQIEAMRELAGIGEIEVSVERLLDDDERGGEIRRVVELANKLIGGGTDTLVYTSRRLIVGGDEASSLKIGQSVSAALVEIVGDIAVRPAWMIAKGGNTSAEIATKSLSVKRAHALGQAIPGVPIWRAGAESRWPNLIYVVFPGNVGGPKALAQMAGVLRESIAPLSLGEGEGHRALA